MFNPIWQAQRIHTYHAVIEGTLTVPAIVLQRFDSPNLSPLCLQYTPLPDRLTEQAGGEVG